MLSLCRIIATKCDVYRASNRVKHQPDLVLFIHRGGDTNAMTVVGETRVIPEWLGQTYERLRPLFEQMGAQEETGNQQ